MNDLIQRYLTPIIGGLIALLVVSLVGNGVLLARSQRTDRRLDEVAVGAAGVVGQAQDFQQQLDSLTPLVEAALAEAIGELEAFATSTIEFAADVDESIPIQADIPFRRMLQLPIRTSIPIDEEIETTITVEGPLGLDIPVDVIVPVSIVVPIDVEVPLDIDERVSFESSLDVALTVPVRVNVADTSLGPLVTRLVEGLGAIAEVVAGLR